MNTNNKTTLIIAIIPTIIIKIISIINNKKTNHEIHTNTKKLMSLMFLIKIDIVQTIKVIIEILVMNHLVFNRILKLLTIKIMNIVTMVKIILIVIIDNRIITKTRIKIEMISIIRIPIIINDHLININSNNYSINHKLIIKEIIIKTTGINNQIRDLLKISNSTNQLHYMGDRNKHNKTKT